MFSSDMIGISEHKFREGPDIYNNIDITGYTIFDFEPIETTHDGTGCYVKSNLVFKVKKELNLKRLEAEFEENVINGLDWDEICMLICILNLKSNKTSNTKILDKHQNKRPLC